jgi:hypothetical protein
MARNDTAAPAHVCPGIRIHAIDIIQPPRIDISPIADMDEHQSIVTAVLAAKSNAEMPKKARSDARPDTMPATMALEDRLSKCSSSERTPLIETT